MARRYTQWLRSTLDAGPSHKDFTRALEHYEISRANSRDWEMEHRDERRIYHREYMRSDRQKEENRARAKRRYWERISSMKKKGPTYRRHLPTMPMLYELRRLHNDGGVMRRRHREKARDMGFVDVWCECDVLTPAGEAIVALAEAAGILR